MELTLDLFRVLTGAPKDRAELYYPHAVKEMKHRIDTRERVASFLANVAIETGRLSTMEESCYYTDPARIVKLYLRVFDTNKNRIADLEEIEKAKAYVKNHAAMSKLLYQGYHGRGALQLTWQANYAKASLSLDIDYVNNPDWVAKPEHAFKTAVDFFLRSGANEMCGNFKACVGAINPAFMHLAERTAQFEKNLQVLA
jgi:putative chitinase